MTPADDSRLPAGDWLRQFRFLKGAATLRQLPPDQGREVAFSGRSNSGKSSVINSLTGSRALARVSKTPGRTRQINFFEHDRGDLRIVDLPGYGFARVDRQTRQSWQALLQGYFAQRGSLVGVALIMDIRHPMREHDQAMLALAGTCGLPIHILLNKADKLSRSAAVRSLRAIGEPGGASVQLFSALKAQGREELRAVLERWFKSGD